MANVIVSLNCTNCGNPVVVNLDTAKCGGYTQCCYNCSGNLTFTVSWGVNNQPIIRNVKTMGGAKRK